MKKNLKKFWAIIAVFALFSVNIFGAGAVNAKAVEGEQQQEEISNQEEEIIDQDNDTGNPDDDETNLENGDDESGEDDENGTSDLENPDENSDQEEGSSEEPAPKPRMMLFGAAPEPNHVVQFDIGGDGTLEYSFNGDSWTTAPSEGLSSVDNGATIYLKATPNSGKKIDDWTNGSETQNWVSCNGTRTYLGINQLTDGTASFTYADGNTYTVQVKFIDDQGGPAPSGNPVSFNLREGGTLEYRIGDGSWTTAPSEGLSSVEDGATIYLQATPNSGKKIDDWTDGSETQNWVECDGTPTYFAIDELTEGTASFTYTEGKNYRVQVSFVNSGDPGPGGNPENPGIRWNDLGNSNKVDAVEYSLDGGSNWNSADSNSISIDENTHIRLRVRFVNPSEGESYQVKANSEIGLLKFEHCETHSMVQYRYGEKQDESPEFAPSDEFVNSLATNEGAEIIFKPEADSRNADGQPGIPHDKAILVLQFNVNTVYEGGGFANVFVYSQFSEPNGDYGIYTDIAGVWGYHEGVIADSEGISMSLNSNDYSTGINPEEHGYGFGGGDGETIHYTSAHGGNRGQGVDGSVFSYVAFIDLPTMADDNSITIKDSAMASGLVIYSDTEEENNRDFTMNAVTMINEGNGVFTCKVPKAAEYRILIRKNTPTDLRLAWQYTDSTQDNYVDHGKIFVEEIIRGDSTILGGISKDASGNITVNQNGVPTYSIDTLTDSSVTQQHLQKWRISDVDGFFRLENGDEVTIRLIPTYGYQISSVNLNGMTLTPQSFKSTFKFTVQGHMNLAGSFVQTNDQTNNSSSKVTGAGIANGQNAADTGNLKLSISDNSGYEKIEEAKTQALSGSTETNAETLATLNLSLDNIVSQGNGAYWTDNITSFDNEINVSLTVPGIGNGQTVKVIRDHEGELTTLDASYDASTGSVSFPTNQFSTYSVIVVGEAVPSPSPSPTKPSETKSSEQTSETPSAGSSDSSSVVPAAVPDTTVVAAIGGTTVTEKDTKDNVAVMVGGTTNGAKISEWNELAAYLAAPQTAPLAASAPQAATSASGTPTGVTASTSEAAAQLAQPVELVLCKKNTVVPEAVFDALAVNPAPSMHIHVRDGVAVNFINDANLINQKSVDLKCVITSQKGYAKRIAFNSNAMLNAVTTIHATVPKTVKSVNVYAIDKQGKKTLFWANIPVIDGRYCFLINQLGTFEIEY